MADASISQYHKYIDLQNVSGSGDPASAPDGGIYLFASGAVGSAKLYLQNEGVSTPLSLADGGTLQIAGDSGTDTVNLSGDTFTFAGGDGLTSAVTDNQVSLAVNVDDTGIEINSDSLRLKDSGVATAKLADNAVTNVKLADIARGSVKVGGASDAPTDLDAKGDGKILVGDGTDVNSVAVSGDITLANDGTVAIASGVIVNADINSAAAIDMDKLDGGSLASSLSDLAQGDLLYAGDVDDSNNLKSITFSNFEDAIFGNVGGQAAVAAGGDLSLTVAAITGQAEMTGDVADADEFMISDGGVLKRADFSVVRDAVFGDVSSEISIAAGGAATVADNVIDESNLKASVAGNGLTGGNGSALAVQVSGSVVIDNDKVGLSGSIAGNGLGYAGGVNSISALSVNVDDTGIEINSDSLRLKDSGVVTAKIADDAVTGAKIAADAVDSEHFAAGSIDTEHIADLQVTTGKLAADAVTAAKLADNAVVTANIVDENVTTAKLAADAVTGAKIANDAVNSEHITLGALDAEHYSSGSIENGHLAGSIANAKLSNSSVTVSAGDGLGGGGEVALGASVTLSVDVSDFAGTGLEDDGSENLRISAAAAGAGLAGGAGSALSVNVDDTGIEIDSDTLRLKDSGVVTAKLAADAVTGAKIADNAVDSEHIALGALDSEHYATGSIESNHLKGSVANAKLANSAVTLGSTSVSLGATTDTIAGLAQLTASFVQVNNGLFPDAAGGATLGNASLGFGDVFIADDKALHFGNSQDVKMEYNEDGDDEFEVTIPTNGMRLHGPTDTALFVGDGEGGDKRIVFDGQAVDFHVGLDHDNQKLSLGLGSTPGSTANMLLASADRDVEFLGNISVPQTKIVSLDTDGDTSLRASADDVMQLRVGGTDMATVQSTGFGVNGGYTSGNGVSLGADGSGNFDGNLNIGRSGGSNGASLTAHGDGNNQKMFFNHATNKLAFTKDDGTGSQETILNIAGAADTDFAIEVAQGSDNINKIKASAFVTYSDESLKSDIETMNTALDTVMSLNGVEFTWKNSGERDFGFIAQEVQKVVPQAVHVASDGVQGVDYSRLTSVLVEAVKAQQVQIEELKAILKK